MAHLKQVGFHYGAIRHLEESRFCIRCYLLISYAHFYQLQTRTFTSVAYCFGREECKSAVSTENHQTIPSTGCPFAKLISLQSVACIIVGEMAPLQIQHGQTVKGTYPYIILAVEPHGSYIVVR